MRNCFHGSEQPMNSRTQNEPGVRLPGSLLDRASDFMVHFRAGRQILRIMLKGPWKKGSAGINPGRAFSASFHSIRPFRIFNFYRYNSLLFSFGTNGDFRI